MRITTSNNCNAIKAPDISGKSVAALIHDKAQRIRSKTPYSTTCTTPEGNVVFCELQKKTARNDTTQIKFNDNQEHKLNAIKIIQST